MVPWRSLTDSENLYEVNEPIGAFVSITSVAYALMYANVYFEAQKRLDELKKYQTIPTPPLSTNLELFLNEYCVCEAWKNKNPK